MPKGNQVKKTSSSSISGEGSLSFNSKQLLDATVGGVRCLVGGGKFDGHDELTKNSIMNSDFDKDFTTMEEDRKRDSSPSYEPRRRGGEQYLRPYGAKRFGLNLANKKYNNLDWLGTSKNNNRIRSVDGEWPVAYHGSTEQNAKSILVEGLRMELTTRQAHGSGIYCTPDPNTALDYATEYKYTDGNHYKLVFQARVDIGRRKIVDPSEHEVPDHADYWVMSDDDSIRTYGICIFKC